MRARMIALIVFVMAVAMAQPVMAGQAREGASERNVLDFRVEITNPEKPHINTTPDGDGGLVLTCGCLNHRVPAF